MSSARSHSSVRWSDLTHPVVAGPSKRRVAGIAAGVLCILVGVLAGAMVDARAREASLPVNKGAS
jgi:hypothetical protein